MNMHESVFYFVINMSISGSFVILLLLIIRQIKLIPKSHIYVLWLVALIRMTLPFAMSSSISVFNCLSGLIKRLIPVGNLPHANLTVSNYFNAALSYKPMEYKTQRFEWVFGISSGIWWMGVCVFLIGAIIIYCSAIHQYKNAIHVRDNIYEDSNASSPFLLGIKSPKIIVPIGLNIDSPRAAHMIAHEKIHVQRMDNLWRIIGLVAVCIHWFNPIAWIGFSFFLKDMELSCDETTVKAYDFAKKKEYAEALLSIAGNVQNKDIAHVSFGKSNAKSRILNVMTYRRLSVLGIAVSIIFLLFISTMLLTNPNG
ncbi:MAG: M56 family metallopeptidase [Eubacteriales bacterium]|nr:M56 family metallopeptidase [Eubacteriales bacterium]